MISNARGEPMYASPVMSKEVGMGTPSHSRGLPPVGNFAPTPVVKDNKRKRGERQGTAGSAPDGAPGPANGKVPFPGPGGKVSADIPSSRDGQCNSNHVTMRGCCRPLHSRV
jgi:paired amphipathic helix protein Sin3a